MCAGAFVNVYWCVNDIAAVETRGGYLGGRGKDDGDAWNQVWPAKARVEYSALFNGKRGSGRRVLLGSSLSILPRF